MNISHTIGGLRMTNIVLEGKCKNEKIVNGITTLIIGKERVNPLYVTSYTVIDESNKDQYSFWKGALGVALFGGIGAIAGLKGKKSKEYMVAIQWKDGEKSLICIDDECYKTLVKCMF